MLATHADGTRAIRLPLAVRKLELHFINPLATHAREVEMIGFDAVNLEHAAAGGRTFGEVEGLEAHRIEEPLETFERGFFHDHPPENETVAAILARRGSIDHPSGRPEIFTVDVCL